MGVGPKEYSRNCRSHTSAASILLCILSMMKDKENHRLSRRLTSRYGGRVRDRFNSFVVKSSLIDDKAVHNAQDFEYLRPIEDAWKMIRQDAKAVLRNIDSIPPLGDISPDHRRLDYTHKWRAYFLWGYGIRVEKNCARCPRTSTLVESIPGLITAMFSIHEAGAHLPGHRGVTKGMLTYHLGLNRGQYTYFIESFCQE